MKGPKQKPPARTSPSHAPSPQALPSAPLPEWRRHVPWVAALWLLALLAYSNSFGSGMVLDNVWLIQEDPRIRAVTPQNLRLIWTQDYWVSRAPVGLYRPLSTVSYLFNYAVLGNGTNPPGYHVVNLILHALNITLVYALGMLLFRDRLAAFAMAGIWGLHPVVTESVTNIIGRSDLLSALGVLGGLLCHVRAVNAGGWRRAGWLAGLALVCAVGVFSKESAVVLIAVLVLYDLSFGRESSWSARIPGYLAAALPCLVYLAVRIRVLAATPIAALPFTDNPLVGTDFWAARLTAIKVLGKYLWLMVWPQHLSCDYSYNQIPLFAWHLQSWEDWKVVVALCVCAACAVTAAWGYLRHRAVFFFIAFFFVCLAPTANLALLIGTIMAERFLYLPSVGFAGCVVLAVWVLVKQPRYCKAVAGVILLALGLRTFARNFDWRDHISIWAAASRTAPDSYKPHWALAQALFHTSLERSIAEAGRALAVLAPLPDALGATSAYETAGICYRAMAERQPAGSPEAQRWYRKSLEALLRGQRVDRAQEQESRRVTLARGMPVTDKGPAFGWPPLYLELGRTYLSLKQPREALEALRYGCWMRQDAAFFQEMSFAYRALNDNNQAAIVLMEGMVVDPGRTELARLLAALYKETETSGCAVSVSPDGSSSINLNCPKVAQQLCAASRNMVRFYLDIGDRTLAARVLTAAVRDLGCPAADFR